MSLSDLPVLPPVAPMLARLAREIPRDANFVFEPKWDGFRCLVFRGGTQVDMRSRSQRPLARYFPELVDAFRSLPEEHFVVDGEIVVASQGSLDFVALLQRLHPARSRVERLRHETPASFVAFDVLARGDNDLRDHVFEARRSELVDVFRDATPPLFVTPATDSAEVADDWLVRFRDGGIDGVVAKPKASAYRAGRREMIKVKTERTADCVVGGFRWHHSGDGVGSLLLGLHDARGLLRHVGLVAAFTAERRRGLVEDLAPLAVRMDGHPWQRGFDPQPGPVARLPGTASRWGYEDAPTWVPLRPTLVCEVAYDHFEGGRFRHAARLRRWRPDRDAASCTFEQLEMSPEVDVSEVLRRGA